MYESFLKQLCTRHCILLASLHRYDYYYVVMRFACHYPIRELMDGN